MKTFRHFAGGGITFNTGGSISTSWIGCGLNPGKLPFPRTRNNIKMDIFNIPRKLGKNVNLSPKHELFLKSNRKSITLFNIRDVEIEPPVLKEIPPPAS